MSALDIINAAFEAAAGIFVLNHCRVLLKDRETRGVSILSTVFFMCWGFWNVFYYPALEQPFSAAAGVFVALANAIYIALMVRFRKPVQPAPMPLIIQPRRTGKAHAQAQYFAQSGVQRHFCLRQAPEPDEHETHHC